MLSFLRIGNRELAALCRRLSTALEAGIDVRSTFAREAAGRGSPGVRSYLARMSEPIAGGSTVADALAQTGEFFPPLMREMVAVGEETGQLAEILRHLADHYDHQVTLRRTFLASITWPAVQLAAAISIVGLLIWVLGVLPPMEGGKRIDILGLGLIGAPGLFVYVLFLACLALAGFAIYQAVQRGVFWTRPLQRAVMRLPVLGGCLQTLALSRLAWSLHLTMETSMDLRRSLLLALRSTRNARYTDDSEQIVADVAAGREIHEALDRTGAYPREFLDTLEVGERSGRLPESMAHLSRQYQDQARRALANLTVVAGFAVWAAVAAVIVALIFRLAFFYIGTITDLAQP